MYTCRVYLMIVSDSSILEKEFNHIITQLCLLAKSNTWAVRIVMSKLSHGWPFSHIFPTKSRANERHDAGSAPSRYSMVCLPPCLQDDTVLRGANAFQQRSAQGKSEAVFLWWRRKMEGAWEGCDMVRGNDILMLFILWPKISRM